MKRSISTLGFMAAFAAGCASSPPPGRVDSTAAAIDTARQAGVEHSADATAQLKMAEDQLAEAKAIIKKDGYNERAQALLTRADADAALAAALSREAKQEAAVSGQKQPVRAKQAPTQTQPAEPSK
jgi:hypothetical protein